MSELTTANPTGRSGRRNTLRRVPLGKWARLLGSGVALSAGLLLAAPLSAQNGLKVYISADMEGITGSVTGEQLGPSGFEYSRFREFMTREVLAAIESARAAGATEFVVSDSHGNGQNLLIDRLPADVQVIRSWPRPLGMVEGIDDSFDAAIFIGYHASTTNMSGVRAHTFSSANYAAVRLNGVDMSEASINAAVAGHFGVPVVMISGDDAIIAEARAVIGDIEGAVVKWSLGFHSARTLTPEAGQAVIRETVPRGLARRDEIVPYRVEAPLTLEVTFKSYTPAEIVSYLPNVDRVDSHTVRFTGQDMVEISRFIQFLGAYQAGLTP